jgi:hypothetical protein
MNILRRISIWALISVFFTSLLLFSYGFTFNETIGRRETVKGWFERSGVYRNFVTEVISLSQAQAATQGNVIDGEILNSAANMSFTPELLQTALEAVLDGSYDWLEGDVSSIEFTIDLTEAKSMYADEITRVAQDRVQQLPSCASDDIPSNFDPFTASCRPSQLDFSSFDEDFRRLIYEDKNFLPNTIITAEALTVDMGTEKQRLDNSLHFMPTAYTLARYVTWVSLVAAFMSMALLIIIANTKRRAIFKIFRGFAFTALSLAVFTFFSSQSTDWLDSVLAIDSSAEGFMQRIIQPLIHTASTDITAWTFRFTLIYGLIALLFLFTWGHMYKKSLKRVKATALRTEEEFLKLEQAFRMRVAKKAKVYKLSNEKRKARLKKKHQKKTDKK